MGLNLGLMTMAQALQETDKAHQYLLGMAMETSDVMKYGLFKDDEKTLYYPIYAHDKSVKAGFVPYLEGIERSYANSVAMTPEQAFKIMFNVQIPHEAIQGKSEDQLAMFKLNQVRQALVAAFQDFDTTTFYGDGDGTTEFMGLHKRLSSGANVINAGGTENRTSIYLQIMGDYDSHFFLPDGQGLTDANVIVNDEPDNIILDANGNEMLGMRLFMQTYAGLVVHSPLAIGQIHGINADHPVTLEMIDALFSAMKMKKMNRKQRAIMWMNDTPYAQMKALFDKEIIRKSYDDWGTLEFDVYDKVKIVTTDAIITGETAKT